MNLQTDDVYENYVWATRALYTSHFFIETSKRGNSVCLLQTCLKLKKTLKPKDTAGLSPSADISAMKESHDMEPGIKYSLSSNVANSFKRLYKYM